jgi:hypothetical protein
VHVSAVSQIPFAPRHTVADELKTSAGQAALEPEQKSAISHTPAEPLHCVDDGRNASDGQAALDPVQVSAASHNPVALLHTVADELNKSVGQVALEPVQNSAASQTPADPLHCVVDGSTEHAPAPLQNPFAQPVIEHSFLRSSLVVWATQEPLTHFMQAPQSSLPSHSGCEPPMKR